MKKSLLILLFAAFLPAQPLYNTAKQKLLDGKQVFSFTQSKFDIRRLLRSGQTLRLCVV